MWPGAPEQLGAVLADDHVPADEVNMMTREDDCRWYSFDASDIPRETATVGALRRGPCSAATSPRLRSLSCEEDPGLAAANLPALLGECELVLGFRDGQRWS